MNMSNSNKKPKMPSSNKVIKTYDSVPPSKNVPIAPSFKQPKNPPPPKKK